MPTLVPALCLALAACGDAPDAGSDARNADGAVLEGSISDAMIPFDQLRSQGEPLEPTDATGEGEDGAARPVGGADAGGADAGGADAGETGAGSDGGPGAAPAAASEVLKQAAPDAG